MAALRDKLIAKGIDAGALDRIKAPAGLDLGAITPEEIAHVDPGRNHRERRRGQRGQSRQNHKEFHHADERQRTHPGLAGNSVGRAQRFEVLKQCIPGCEPWRMSDTEMTAKVVLKVGPIKASFAGKVTLSDLDPPNGYRISGEGSGGVAGFAKGGATCSSKRRVESHRVELYSRCAGWR